MKRRLKIDPSNRRMLDGEVDDLADFVLVHAVLDRGNQRNVQPDGSQPVEGA